MWYKILLVGIIYFGVSGPFSANHLNNTVFAQELKIVGNTAVKDELPMPKQSIVGADKPIEKGELVDLSLSEPDFGKVPDDVSNITYKEFWKVYDYDITDKGIELNEKVVRHYKDPVTGKLGIIFGSGIVDKKMFVSVSVSYTYFYKDNKKSPETKLNVLNTNVIVGVPKPPVPPTPPPTPSDEFVKKLKSNISNADKLLIPQLVNLYDFAGERVVAKSGDGQAYLVDTWGALFNSMSDKARELGVTGKLTAVQKVIAEKLVAELPSKEASEVQIEALQRSKAKEVFSYISQSLKEAIK